MLPFQEWNISIGKSRDRGGRNKEELSVGLSICPVGMLLCDRDSDITVSESSNTTAFARVTPAGAAEPRHPGRAAPAAPAGACLRHEHRPLCQGSLRPPRPLQRPFLRDRLGLDFALVIALSNRQAFCIGYWVQPSTRRKNFPINQESLVDLDR